MAVDPVYHRLQLLTGTPALRRLNDTRVAVFGVGGVGSWAAEALVRSGILDITLVDNDVICITNVNRQLQATTKNVGAAKVDELAARLLTLNPRCNITPNQKVYEPATATEFDLGSFDYVLDCIDSISGKIDLIMRSTAAGTRLYSAMGAAGKLDPTRIRIASIWGTTGGCHLARLIRRRLRAAGFDGDFQAVYSSEVLPLIKPTTVAGDTGSRYILAEGTEQADFGATRKAVNGSAVHITATFGMFLSGLVIQDVVARGGKAPAPKP